MTPNAKKNTKGTYGKPEEAYPARFATCKIPHNFMPTRNDCFLQTRSGLSLLYTIFSWTTLVLEPHFYTISKC